MMGDEKMEKLGVIAQDEWGDVTPEQKEALAEVDRARIKASWGCNPVHRLIPHLVYNVLSGISAGALVWRSENEKVTAYGVELG